MQPISTLSQRLQQKGLGPSPCDNCAKLRQAATNKDSMAGDSNIFIRPRMPFSTWDEGRDRVQRDMATRKTDLDNSGQLPTPEDPLGYTCKFFSILELALKSKTSASR